MNKITSIIIASFFGLILIAGAGIFMQYMNTQSEWNRMNNAVNAAFDRQKNAHDQMWKIISGKMGLKDHLKEITIQAIQAYSERGKAQGNAQWLWLQEQYPQLNQTGMANFYQELARTIENENGKFGSVRNDVIFATNEYNNFVTNSWTRMFLSAEQANTKESKIITSSVTNKAADTLEDNLEWMPKK